MKKMMTCVITVMAMGWLLTGCGPSYDGTDKTVKDTVINIAKNELRDKLTGMIYMQLTNIPLEAIGERVTYEYMKNKASGGDQSAKQTLSKANEAMLIVKMRMENIRTEKVDKILKKSFNRADLLLYNEVSKQTDKLPIQYTAQIADSGVYVEVFGLNF